MVGSGAGDWEWLDVVHNDGLTVHGREEQLIGKSVLSLRVGSVAFCGELLPCCELLRNDDPRIYSFYFRGQLVLSDQKTLDSLLLSC